MKLSHFPGENNRSLLPSANIRLLMEEMFHHYCPIGEVPWVFEPSGMFTVRQALPRTGYSFISFVNRLCGGLICGKINSSVGSNVNSICLPYEILVDFWIWLAKMRGNPVFI
jgi:hypothetical protein